MGDEAKKMDASRRKLLLAGPSLAVLGAVGLERTVQQAQAQTPAPADGGK